MYNVTHCAINTFICAKARESNNHNSFAIIHHFTCNCPVFSYMYVSTRVVHVEEA